MKKLIILFIMCLFLSSCDLVDKLRDIYKEEILNPYENDDDYTNDSLKANGPLTTTAMPSIGDVNVLVIPINFDSNNKTTKIQNDIYIAFNGTRKATGWESVSSYYKESSYEKLNLNFEITDWYTPIETEEFYVNYNNLYETGATYLLREALNNLDSKYDYSKYDYDKDGYIDAVWMVYNKDYDENSEFWWAYSFFNQTNNLYDDVKARYYAFASYKFMYGSEFAIDSTTFIHETGHLLGLDDYYDYNANNIYGGLYGLDMMDMNIGDHASISKILLGWVTPIVVTESGTYEINNFSSSGEVLLIANHELKSIYDEYILIDYYVRSGLNGFANPYNGGSGARVYHVDARLNLDKNNQVVYNGGDYETGFLKDNTDGDEKFVELLRACTTSKVHLNSEYNKDFLYKETSKKFGIDIFSNYKLHDGKPLNFNMEIIERNIYLVKVEIEFK